MSSEKWGSMIGAVFGLAFVLLNTESLPSEISLLLRALAVIAFVAVLGAVWRVVPSQPRGQPRGGFTRGYWLVVAAEVVAIALGLAVLNGRLHAPQAAVTWVSLVVGVHFLALAVLWKLAFFHWLGAAIALCGAVGLVLAATLLELWRRAEDERVEVACLAVIDGVAATDAVQYVRQHYHRRAVETPWQRRYGSQFQP